MSGTAHSVVDDTVRTRFVGLSDEQLEKLAIKNKKYKAESHQVSRTVLMQAKILREFGYHGLRDYLRSKTGVGTLDWLDMLRIIEALDYLDEGERKMRRIDLMDASVLPDLKKSGQRKMRRDTEKMLERFDIEEDI